MLIDKGYYDYDYTEPKKVQKQIRLEDTVKSDEEVKGILSMFGWGKKKAVESATAVAESAEELQRLGMEEAQQ